MKRVVGSARVRKIAMQHARERARLRSLRRASSYSEAKNALDAGPEEVSRARRLIRRNRVRSSIALPRIFSLRENYQQTVAAIQSLRRIVLVEDRPAMILFDEVKVLEPAATLLLSAEIRRCKQYRIHLGNVLINGTYPTDPNLVLQLREMGFYRMIGVPERPDILDDREEIDRPRYLKFFTFDIVEARAAAILTDLVSVGAFSMNDQVKRRMTGAVKEAMGNAVEHAYPSAGDLPAEPGRWYCTAYVNPAAGEMMIGLLDHGVGVPETLDPTVIEVVRSLVSRWSWSPGDGHMIAAATEIYRTSTRQRGRGRGFRDMKRFIDECDDGELRVLSNRGSYRYMKGSEQIDDEELSIGGTLIEWRVRHGQAVEFEDA